MRVLVTGGRGFVGHATTLALLDAGHNVDVLTRSANRGRIPTNVGIVVANLTNREAVFSALENRSYDGVVHAAAVTNNRESFAEPLRYFDVNLGGTSNLLASLARQRPVRFVYTSTNSVYGSRHAGALSEDLDPHPTSPYAASKLAAERLVACQAETGALSAITLRLFNVAGAAGDLGDSDSTRLIPGILEVAAGERPELTINGDGKVKRDYIHALDVAHAIVLALTHTERGKSHVYNVGTGTGFTILDLVDAVEALVGRNIPVRHGPLKPEPPVLVANSALIHRDLGWRPHLSHLATIISDAWRVKSQAIHLADSNEIEK
jgi:UDP-glucose 4-epimerase